MNKDLAKDLAFLCFYVGGGKGGSGKSWIAITLAYYFIMNGIEPIIIEADVRNPDVGRIFANKGAKAFRRPLKNFDTWGKLVDEIVKIQNETNVPIIINSPATIDFEVEDCATVFNRPEIKGLRIIWACGLQGSSMEYLSKFRESITVPPICIVKNGRLGDEENFDITPHQDLPEIYYKQLGDIFTRNVQTHKHPPHEIVNSPDISIGERASAEQQLKIMYKYGEEIIQKSAPDYIKETVNNDNFD